MKFFLVVSFFLCSVSVSAQDVIVKKDGSTILSKVLEVNTSDIKYKKFSNPNGPTYTISKADIMSINYENGEKDLFSDNSVDESSGKVKKISSKENDELICDYNDRIAINLSKKSQKKAKWVYRLLRVHPESLIADNNVRLLVSIDQNKSNAGQPAYFCVSVQNNTEKMLYIDLGSSTFRINKKANKYYVNSSTTTSSGIAGGASVNMGTIASILGVGGTIGALASGVNVNGGKNSGTSTTVYADRIITVAPHSEYTLPYKQFYDSDYDKAYRTDFHYGDHFTFAQPAIIGETPWEFIVSYAEENDLNTTKQLNLGLFVSEELAIGSSWEEGIKDETTQPPLHYFFKVKGGWLNKE